MRCLLLASSLLFAAACGNQIGDSCSLSSDCSTQGDRICDVSSPGGYCTVFGCSHDSCPGGAVCVRFFSAETDILCDAETEDVETDDCTPDEICTLSGYCAPRTAEMRFCMKKCDGSGGCRDDYECRDKMLMMEHGGAPVPPPGERVTDDPQSFCAVAPI